MKSLADLLKDLFQAGIYIKKNVPAVWWMSVFIAFVVAGILLTLNFWWDWRIFSIAFFLVSTLSVSAWILYKAETNDVRWQYRVLSSVLFILALSGFLYWVVMSAHSGWQRITLYCGDSISPDDQDICSQTQYEVKYKIVPTVQYTKTLDKDLTSNVSMPTYKRESCSGRSYGEFRACLLPGSVVENVTITLPEGRNARFEPLDNRVYPEAEDAKKSYSDRDEFGTPRWRRDPDSQNCAIIPWSTASGGRTGIGECRYHGWIRISAAVSGKIATKENQEVKANEQNDKNTPGNYTPVGDVKQYEVLYIGDIHRDNESYQILNWKYEAEVRQFSKKLFRSILGWADKVSDENKSSVCLSSKISDAGKLTLRIDC